MSDKELVVTDYPRERIQSLMASSGITKGFREISRVADIIWNHRTITDLMPSFVEPGPDLEFGSRCLLMAGLYPGYLETRATHSYETVLRKGEGALRSGGYFGVAEHIQNWAEHIHEILEIREENPRGIKEVRVYEKFKCPTRYFS